MRILYVYDGDWPRGATRVEKQTRSLARAGHRVYLLARNSDGAPRREHTEWMTVLRLPSVSIRWVNRILNFPLFVSPVWLWCLRQAARTTRPDCIIVCDLPLALSAIWLAGSLGIPVHYDMAEVYPEFLRSRWEVDRMRWSDRLVRNPAAAAWVERKVLPRVRKIFVVSEESRARCMALGVGPERVVLVGNTPAPFCESSHDVMLPLDLLRWRHHRKVLFVGTLIADRGVVQAVEAMRRVLEHVPDAVLVIVGDGPDRRRIESTIVKHDLREHVALLGWRDHSVLPRYYANADVGLLPFLDSSHVRITLANKLFDYMAAGLACVAADVPPMRRLLQETGAGLLFPPGDVSALAQRITELLRDDRGRALYGSRGRAAVRGKYSWRADEERFLAAIEP